MQHKPPFHVIVEHLERNSNWFPPDTKLEFEQNLAEPDRHAWLDQQGWLDPGAICYDFNSHGFRSQEFCSGTAAIMALGCSFTMGVGLPQREIWCEQVSRALDVQCWNLGWAGASADTCYRMARYWVAQLRPQAVIMCTPPANRLDLFWDSGITRTIMPANPSMAIDEFLKTWMTVDDNAVMNRERNILAIQAICDNADIPFRAYHSEDFFCGERTAVGWARDFQHAGPQAHRTLAERILQDVKI